MTKHGGYHNHITLSRGHELGHEGKQHPAGPLRIFWAGFSIRLRGQASPRERLLCVSGNGQLLSLAEAHGGDHQDAE